MKSPAIPGRFITLIGVDSTLGAPGMFETRPNIMAGTSFAPDMNRVGTIASGLAGDDLTSSARTVQYGSSSPIDSSRATTNLVVRLTFQLIGAGDGFAQIMGANLPGDAGSEGDSFAFGTNVVVLTGPGPIPASYVRIGGAIIFPIQFTFGGMHPYNGPNLAPFAVLGSVNLAGADLIAADLTSADLTSANLTGADLTGANLTSADLTGANLFFASLSEAVMSFSILSGADLAFADLSNVDFSGTDLSGADLTGALLVGVSGQLAAVPSLLPAGYVTANNYIVGPGVDLTGADLSGADLTGVDLTGVEYDEFTVFPSGTLYDIPTWGLDGGITPWNAGMIPVPEPSFGLLLVCGAIGLLGLVAMKGSAWGPERATSKRQI